MLDLELYASLFKPSSEKFYFIYGFYRKFTIDISERQKTKLWRNFLENYHVSNKD